MFFSSSFSSSSFVLWLSLFHLHKPREADDILLLAENKVSIVMLGGLAPLIRQMMSTNVEVQCNAVGCITNLATHEENKAKIAGSGALGPLTRLARSKDMRVQRNATGALLNMTHSGTYPCQHPRVCFPTNVLSSQMKTGSSLSWRAQYRSWSSCLPHRMSMSSTTAPQRLATLLLTL